jgi:hypothetical protein
MGFRNFIILNDIRKSAFRRKFTIISTVEHEKTNIFLKKLHTIIDIARSSYIKSRPKLTPINHVNL